MAGLDSLVLTILALLVLIIFFGSIYAFFRAIWLFIFSAGDAEKIKQAWNSIRFMIVGIIMTLAFLFIFPVIFKRMAVPGYEQYTAENIFRQATLIMRSIFSFGREAADTYNGGADGGYFNPSDGGTASPSSDLEL